MKKPWWQSKTKWGAVLLAAGQALRQLPWEWAQQAVPVADVLGTVIGGFGVRDALEPSR